MATNLITKVRNLLRENRKFAWFILIVAILNVTVFSIFLKKIEVTEEEFSSVYPLIDPSRSFVSQEDYIVNLQPLREDLREIAEEFGNDKVSVYIEFLNTGANIAINNQNYIWPASLSKVPLAMAVVKKIEEGIWTWDNELVLLKEDLDEKSGDDEDPLGENVIGTRFSIETLLGELLVNSDNTAYFILLRNLSSDDLKKVIEELGLEAMFTEEGRISAKEYSRIFRSLYVSSFLEPENSQRILNWLDESSFDEFLVKGISSDVVFSHKYGENIELNAYSDSGIVYVEGRPYIISVMVQGDEKNDYEAERSIASDFMTEVSKKTFDYFSIYSKGED